MWRHRYIAGIIILLASGLLLLLPFLFRPQKPRTFTLNWAPGYWAVIPEIGLARIVPFSRSNLVNPAAGSGPSQIREPADRRIAPKY